MIKRRYIAICVSFLFFMFSLVFVSATCPTGTCYEFGKNTCTGSISSLNSQYPCPPGFYRTNAEEAYCNCHERVCQEGYHSNSALQCISNFECNDYSMVSLFWDSRTSRCVENCPVNSITNSSTNTCDYVSYQCPPGYVYETRFNSVLNSNVAECYYSPTNTQNPICSDDTLYGSVYWRNKEDWTCNIINNLTGVKVSSCPAGTVLDETSGSSRQCVCPQGWHPENGQCVDNFKNHADEYYDPLTQTYVGSCSNGGVLNEETNSCYYPNALGPNSCGPGSYFDSSKQSCQPIPDPMTCSDPLYFDRFSMSCTDVIPVGNHPEVRYDSFGTPYYVYISNFICSPSIWDPGTGSCVVNCPAGTTFNPSTNICEGTAINPPSGNNTIPSFVARCLIGYTYDASTNVCTRNPCPSGQEYWITQDKCVDSSTVELCKQGDPDYPRAGPAACSSLGLDYCGEDKGYHDRLREPCCDNTEAHTDDDEDGYPPLGSDECDTTDFAFDCDDTEDDDPAICAEIPKIDDYGTKDLSQCLTLDRDNDGAPDFSGCSFCRNPGQTEICDDVDNNCRGTCQGNPTILCKVPNTDVYEGDGKGGYECAGVTNKYGVGDNFCQMVDDNVFFDVLNTASQIITGTCTTGYNRCVKWGEKITGTIGSSDATLTTTSYKPGGVYNELVENNAILDVKPIFSNSNIYSKEKTKFTFGDFYNTRCFIIKNMQAKLTQTYKTVMIGSVSTSESYDVWTILDTLNINDFAGTFNESKPLIRRMAENALRVSAGVPDQFIDSFRGECNFTLFWAQATNIQEVGFNITDNNTWQWKNACVIKDKCADKADNDGLENLTQIAPYGFYIPILQTFTVEDGNGVKNNVLDLNKQIQSRLVDVDDPQCKFNENKWVQVTSQEVFPKYVEADFRPNPVHDSGDYCLDDDKDGFCGCSSPVNVAGQIYGMSSCNIDPEEESTNGNLLSKQFPDCDDSNLVPYYSNGATLKVWEYLGWPDYPIVSNSTVDLNSILGSEYSSWNVHPLAPVTFGTCNVQDYDFNCNKNGKEGYDIFSLARGNTPFDWDTRTGREIYIPLTNNNFIAFFTFDNWFNKPRDAACIVDNTRQNKIIGKFLGESAFTVATVGAFSALKNVPLFIRVMNNPLTQVAFAAQSTIQIKEAASDFGNCLYGTSNTRVIRFADCLKGTSNAFLGGFGLYAAWNLGTGKNLKISTDKTGKTTVTKGDGSPNKVSETTIDTKPAEPTVENPKAGGCFLENTRIVMADGSIKDIEDIQVGEEVEAYDLESNKAVNATITTTFIRNETRYRIIKYEAVE